MEAVDDTMGDGEKSSEDSAAVVAPIKKSHTNENWCEICSKWIKKDFSVKDHEAGKPHQQKKLEQQLLIERSKEHENTGSGIWNCKVCNVKMNSPMMLETHMNGSKHMIQVKKQMKMEGASPNDAADAVEEYSKKPKIMCDICNCLIIDDPGKITSHCEGAKHIKKVASNKLIEKLRKEEDYFDQDPVSGVMRCSLCNLDLETPNHMKMHFSGAKHKLKVTSKAEWSAEKIAATGGFPAQSAMVGGRPVKRKYNNIPTQRYDDYYNYTPTNRYDDYYNPTNRLAENPGYEDHIDEIKNPDCTVEIRNLPFQTQKKDIYDVFENCGKIEDMFHGFTTQQTKKIWYLIFKEREAAVKALEKNEAVFQESLMYVSAYRHPEENNQRRKQANPSFNDYVEESSKYDRLDHNQSRMPDDRRDYDRSGIPGERWHHNQSRIPEDRWDYSQCRLSEERGNYEGRRMAERISFPRRVTAVTDQEMHYHRIQKLRMLEF